MLEPRWNMLLIDRAALRWTTGWALLIAAVIGSAQGADDPLATRNSLIVLWPDGAPGAVGTEEADKPSLSVFLPKPDAANGSAMVVCPGGGYGHLAVGHEGREVADWLTGHGTTVFVLKYRLAPRYHHPAPLQDVQRAIRTVRARAAEWKLDPARIGVLGFSAGGHLASTAATKFDAGTPNAADPIEQASCRPDVAVLCYPVISLVESYTHAGSRKNLLADKVSDAALVESLSNEKQVTKETPPTFLFHTSADTAVPPENSVAFYSALRRAGVASEMHIYEKGAHGVGLAPKDPVLSTWPARCAAWLDTRGFFKKP